MPHIYIFSTIFFTTLSQLLMRWQVGLAGPLPGDAWGKAGFVGALLLNPWIIASVVSTFLAGVSWMLALTKFEISYAYPFSALTYVLVLLAGVVLFQDDANLGKIAGTALVILGVVVIARFS